MCKQPLPTTRFSSGSGQVFVNTPPPRAGAYQSRHVRGPSPRTHQVSLYVCQHARSRTNLVRSQGGVLNTLGHSKRRGTREDACETETRGCWAVRPRSSGGCRDGCFLRDLFFDKPSRLRHARKSKAPDGVPRCANYIYMHIYNDRNTESD